MSSRKPHACGDECERCEYSPSFYGARGFFDHRPGRLVLLYLDGTYGIGKTTTALEIAKAENSFTCLYLSEPLRAWRNWFPGRDAIAEIYDTQTKLLDGRITEDEASMRTVHAQTCLSGPFHVMHDLISDVVGSTPGPMGPLGAGDVLCVLDRHPIASCICFPVARYVNGYITLPDLVSLLSCIPPPGPATNLVIMDLDLEEQMRRILVRSRPGETVDCEFLTTLRNIYVIVANTNKFLMENHCSLVYEMSKLPDFNDSKLNVAIRKKVMQPVDHPTMEDTLFAVLKDSVMDGPDGRLSPLFSWVLARIGRMLRNMRVFFLRIDQHTPSDCAEAVLACASVADSLTVSAEAVSCMAMITKSYNADMAV